MYGYFYKPTVLFNKLDVLEASKKDFPIIIRLAALSFAFALKNQYKAPILSNNNKEMRIDNENSVQLTNLLPGKNRLQLMNVVQEYLKKANWKKIIKTV